MANGLGKVLTFGWKKTAPALAPAPDFELARAPKMVFEALKKRGVQWLPITEMGKLLEGRDPSPEYEMERGSASRMAAWFFHSSDLHKGLEAAYGKCDGMVAGKYKRARAFVFETPSCWLLATTETGDRGSGWSAALKADGLDAGAQDYSEVFKLEQEWPKEALSELSVALRDVLLRVAETDTVPGRDSKYGLGAEFVSGLAAREQARRERLVLDGEVPKAKGKSKAPTSF